tara:strand:+ start:675 stop:797 length:123 start_codon:yes stop_codon:yes gene_type:complete
MQITAEMLVNTAPQCWWIWVAPIVQITKALLSSLDPSRLF